MKDLIYGIAVVVISIFLHLALIAGIALVIVKVLQAMGVV